MTRTLTRRVTVSLAVLGLTAGAAVSTAAAAPSLQAAPVTVNLTVTGPTSVLFDDQVTTDGGVVTPLTETAQLCDGTNFGANPTAGATPTTALNDSGLDWDGIWYTSFEDYLVTEIDGVVQTDSDFWLISVNGQATPVGGCQFLVENGDDVEFVWTDY
ncbi:DUF4430 domain-containing protein [Streptomyces lonarensis]|uniref:DUF4430 domain-containing protein n=1 Tax=Streptomyces lonarensis TaxID=700599 RepID=A0A7X6D2F1_9ACTN|nr:DUF4430 domain-containing protein [Streptomyces lonarensis]NJQ06954.1 DUF4430 domain-containing protein [Streptomyces lonarensis]